MTNLDKNMDLIINDWEKFTKKLDKDLAADKNFIVFGFELLEISEQFKLTTDIIKDALYSLPSRDKNHQFFEPDYGIQTEGDEAIHVITKNSIDGLQASITGTPITKDHNGTQPVQWHVSESGTGVSIQMYWEDSICLEELVKSKYNDVWKRGSYIWMGSQINFIGQFLADIWQFADFVDFQDKVRIKIKYQGLKNRKLNSPDPFDRVCSRHIAKQDTRLINFIFQLDELAPVIRNSAIALIAQELNKIFQGSPINVENVLERI